MELSSHIHNMVEQSIVDINVTDDTLQEKENLGMNVVTILMRKLLLYKYINYMAFNYKLKHTFSCTAY